MPAQREITNVHIYDVSPDNLLRIRRAMHAHKIEIEIDVVLIPATNFNPTTGKYDL